MARIKFPEAILALSLGNIGCGSTEELPKPPIENQDCILKNLKELCGYNAEVIKRITWGNGLKNQNLGVTLPSGKILDPLNRETIIEGILNNQYPPFLPWPEAVGFPASYNVGDELHALKKLHPLNPSNPNEFTFDWSSNELNWEVKWQPLKDIHTIVVHYTATTIPEGENCSQHLQHITNFHTFDHGWGDIGYNFLVCKDPVSKKIGIYQGRAKAASLELKTEWNPTLMDFKGQWHSIQSVGAHSPPNTGTVGVSLVLGENIEPSLEELEVYKRTIARIALETNILGPQIVGHSDRDKILHPDNPTLCPGNLYPHLDEIRGRVNQCLQCREDLRWHF